ncbi:DNA-deoxyinosine glycosylase [Mycolicibacterium phlei]
MGSPVLRGLPPIVGPGAHTLILGNMPSVMSLARQEYYGNPRNAFWPIMGELLGFDPEDPYDVRCAALTARGIAVWDVLASCRRAGSLDSAVEPNSMVPNDFAVFFGAQRITRVLFNGAAAERNYRRLVGEVPAPASRRLPSTSPAQTMRYADKLAAWRAALA